VVLTKIGHITSTTGVLAWLTLRSNIKSYIKKWSKSFANRWRRCWDW